MPRGGARPGAGRKPNPPNEGSKVFSIYRQPKAAEPAPPVIAGSPLLEPPAELAADVQAVWRKLSRHALGERTLTESTAAGFVELCQQSVDLQSVHQTIQRLGAGTKEAEPYFRTYLKLAQRFDSSLARFKLTAFG